MGLKYWESENKAGRKPKYTPDELWKRAIAYFERVESDPLIEERPSGGDVVPLKKMRAMTIRGFCLFACIDRTTFDEYEKQEAFSHIIARIRDIIYVQKFEGAAAGLLNANIIARELGLSEKSDVNLKSIPKEIQDNVDGMTASDIATLIGNGM